jgi:hypothetical protein
LAPRLRQLPDFRQPEVRQPWSETHMGIEDK